MGKLLLAITATLALHQTAAAIWPTIPVTREKAEREKLPVTITVTPLGNGTLTVNYEIILTGPLAYLSTAQIVATDGNDLLFQVPIATPSVRLPMNGKPVGKRDATRKVEGVFRVSKALLRKTRLNLDCPVEPLSLGGQTFSIDLASYLKRRQLPSLPDR
jgi:hypothetical protein